MRTKNLNSGRLRRFRPTPALVVAFVALFAAMGGIGYSAVKLKPNSVRAKNIHAAAVTTDKIANGAVTTPKLAPDAVAPYATNAVNAMNAAKLEESLRAVVRRAGSRPRRPPTRPRSMERSASRSAFRASTAPARPMTPCRFRGKRSGSTR